jgi:hypothetical protein
VPFPVGVTYNTQTYCEGEKASDSNTLLSTGAIIGIAVGAFVLLAGLVLLAYFACGPKQAAVASA